MANPVTHFEVVGKDAELLQEFYAAAFGWDVKPQMPGYAMVHPGGAEGISGGIGRAEDGGPGHVTFYVQVTDVSAALEKITSLGGRTILPETTIPGGPVIGHFQDPEGHLIGLAKKRGAA
jgi:predicted enzyme related to lactoylglutathione lyase